MPSLAIFLPLLIAYEAALRWCWDLWWKPDYYFGHGPLVPIVMAAVIWQTRRQWERRPAQLDRRGWLLLGPALFVHLCGTALTIDSLSAASLAIAVPGAAWLALGRERLRGQWPVLWLFAFAVPLPLYVTGRLAFELKEIAVQGGVALARLTGLAVEHVGAKLHVPGRELPLDVADPCGGLRSLLAMVTLSYCIAFFLGPRQRWRLAVLLLTAGPIALMVNLLRITSICWLARLYDVQFATGTGHDLMNALAWIIDLGCVFALDSLCTQKTVRKGAPTVVPVPADVAAVAMPPLRSLRGTAVLLWMLCVPLLVLSETRPYTDSRGRAERLPATIGGFTQQNHYDLDKRYFDLLGTDDATWRSYQVGKEICYVVAVFHGTNWKSVHPPHVCLLASDMEMLADDEVELTGVADLAAGTKVGHIVLRTKKDGRPYVCVYAYVARDLCTGSYASFFLHHAPRALFRASNDGCLLRIDAWGDGEGGIAGAEQRCKQLLASLLVEARRLLP